MPSEEKFDFKLQSGYAMPGVGLGTYAPKQGEEEVIAAVKTALKCGYRHLDCAAIYRNERAVGHAIKESFVENTVKREDLFICSKYLDLYLIHWPMGYLEGGEFHPKDENGKILFSDVDYVKTWKALEDCVDEGLTRSIGLSNFNSKQIQRILDEARIKPSVVQVECTVHLNNDKLLHSSISGLKEPVIKEISQKRNKTPSQVILRFQLQRGICVIPKSVTASRIIENFECTGSQFSHLMGDKDSDFCPQVICLLILSE
ncbi:hypothetical protein KUTeg_022927, partial [Tegillarca granosa]